MYSVTRTLSVLALALALAGLSWAGQKQEEKKPADPYAKVFSFPKEIKLTDEQAAKLADLKKDYTPKLEEADKKIDAVLTPERKKVSQEATKKAKDEGKKGKEVQEAVNAALKLGDEEQQLKEAR